MSVYDESLDINMAQCRWRFAELAVPAIEKTMVEMLSEHGVSLRFDDAANGQTIAVHLSVFFPIPQEFVSNSLLWQERAVNRAAEVLCRLILQRTRKSEVSVPHVTFECADNPRGVEELLDDDGDVIRKGETMSFGWVAWTECQLDEVV